MKDYSGLGNNNFILFYSKSEEELFVYTASGSYYKIPYSVHNEELLLERMKLQVIKYNDFEKEKVNTMLKHAGYMFLDLLGAYINYATYDISNIKAFNVIVSVVLSALAIAQFNEIRNISSIVSDYQKNRWFIDNEEIINKYVDGEKININDMDSLSKNEIIEMIYYAKSKERKLK